MRDMNERQRRLSVHGLMRERVRQVRFVGMLSPLQAIGLRFVPVLLLAGLQRHRMGLEQNSNS